MIVLSALNIHCSAHPWCSLQLQRENVGMLLLFLLIHIFNLFKYTSVLWLLSLAVADLKNIAVVVIMSLYCPRHVLGWIGCFENLPVGVVGGGSTGL